MEIFRDIAQGTDEWFAVRAGLPTASEFAKVCAKAGPRGGTSHKEYVGRTKYMDQLCAEIITGEPQESEWKGNRHTERGKEREDEARSLYAFLNDVEPEQVGFVRNGNCGCSPDSLIGDNGMLEIKDAIGSVQIARLRAGTLPPEHRLQCLGNLLVAEREWIDFMSHSRGLPPLIVRVHRDEIALDELRRSVDKFVDELNNLVEWVKRM